MSGGLCYYIEYTDKLILSKDLGYADATDAVSLLHEVSKLLEAYSRSILNSDSS